MKLIIILLLLVFVANSLKTQFLSHLSHNLESAAEATDLQNGNKQIKKTTKTVLQGDQCNEGNELAGSNFLVKGYNIIKADPLSEQGLDPGISRSRIFEGNGDSENCAYGAVYSKYIDLMPVNKCNKDAESKFYSSTNSLKTSFSTEFGVSAKTAKGGFSSTNSLSMGTSSESKRESSIATVEIKCRSYKVQLSPEKPKTFTSSFSQSILELPATYNNNTREAYFTFLDEFGTHVFLEMQLGSQYGKAYRLDSSMDKKTFEMKASSEVEASIGTDDNGAKAKSKTEAGISSEQTTENKMERLREFNKGQINKKDVGYSGVPEEAIPIDFKLAPISDLFSNTGGWRNIDQSFFSPPKPKNQNQNKANNQKNNTKGGNKKKVAIPNPNPNKLTFPILKKNLDLALNDYCEFAAKENPMVQCADQKDPVYFITKVEFKVYSQEESNPCGAGFTDWTPFYAPEKKVIDLNKNAGGYKIYGCQKSENVMKPDGTLKPHISEIKLTTDYRYESGWNCYQNDLNDDAGGSYLYFCWKETTENTGIKHFGVMNKNLDFCNANSNNMDFSKDANNPDCRVYQCLCYDLNAGAGGDYLMTCYTKDRDCKKAL